MNLDNEFEDLPCELAGTPNIDSSGEWDFLEKFFPVVLVTVIPTGLICR